MSPFADLVAWRASVAARRLRDTDPSFAAVAPEHDPVLEERVADAVRVETMRDALEAARAAPEGRDGEAARAVLRLAAEIYLDRVEPALASAVRERRAAELARWAGQIDAALAAEPDAARRSAAADAFAAALDRLAGLEAELREARDAAARRLGADGARALLAAAWSPAAAGIAGEVERGFIAPLDEAVASAVAERARRLGRPFRAEDVPRSSWLPAWSALYAPQRGAPVLRRLGAALGDDPDARGARLVAAEPRRASPEVHDRLAGRAVVVLGIWGGPRGFVDACAALGRAQRASFLVRARGVVDASRADPAFAHAAATLFRRLAASREGLALAATAAPEEAMADLHLEETIAARCAWAALAAGCGDAGTAGAAWQRAAARPPSPGERDRAAHDEDDPSARVRGICFGLLVEERLKTRFGRAWFSAPGAGSALRDLWAAEPGESPESMAAALGLGTMDSSPLLEAFQPRKGRVF